MLSTTTAIPEWLGMSVHLLPMGLRSSLLSRATFVSLVGPGETIGSSYEEATHRPKTHGEGHCMFRRCGRDSRWDMRPSEALFDMQVHKLASEFHRPDQHVGTS